MRKLNRRTLMATGTTLAAGGLLGSTATAQEGDNGEAGEENGGGGSADFERPDGIAWRYDGAHDIRRATVAHGRLYTEHDGSVSAIDTADGSLVWETGEIEARGAPVVEDEMVYVPGERVQALDAETGEVQWESDVGRFTMAVGHGMVYTSDEGTVYALDAGDGSIEWERSELTVEWDISGETEEFTVDNLEAGDTDDDLVYVSGDVETAFTVAGLDPMTGELEMTMGRTEEVAGLTAESGYMGIQPNFDSSYLYDISTKERLGSVDQSVGYTFSGNGFFGATHRGVVSAYDLSAGGELAWEMEYAQSFPQVVGNTAIALYGPNSLQHDPEASEDEDRVIAYDLQTGEEQWRYVLDESEWDSAPSSGLLTGVEIDENTVYVSRNGELLALRSDIEDEEEGDGEPEEGDSEEEEPEDDDPEEESDGPEESEEDPEEEEEPEDDVADTNVELSVSAPDSIDRGESASVDVRVWNHGEDAAEITISLEAGDVAESTTVEIAPDDCYASFHSVPCGDLSLGENEWTVTANGDTESGVLTLTDE